MPIEGGPTQMLDLHAAAAEMSRVVRATRDEQLADPTPCAAMSVGALLDHIAGLALAFTAAARKQSRTSDPPPPDPDAAALPADWRTVLPERLAALADAWTHPGAWEGATVAGGVQLPAGEMGVVALDELVLHGWDLARATGQSFTCDPVSTRAILEFTAATAAPEAAGMRDGLFGPAVEVPETASDFDKALGFAGRDPGWTAPRPTGGVG